MSRRIILRDLGASHNEQAIEYQAPAILDNAPAAGEYSRGINALLMKEAVLRS
jgi:hypothetical protein